MYRVKGNVEQKQSRTTGRAEVEKNDRKSRKRAE
jgi:hypothetical protein